MGTCDVEVGHNAVTNERVGEFRVCSEFRAHIINNLFIYYTYYHQHGWRISQRSPAVGYREKYTHNMFDTAL